MKRFIIGILVLIVAVFIINGFSKNDADRAYDSKPKSVSPQAQEDYDDFVQLSKKTGLISSVDSDNSVYYVTDAWYDLPVTFKKDFIGKIGLLQKAKTGYAHMEIRNYKSNDLVGELTSFSQSIEVYK